MPNFNDGSQFFAEEQAAALETSTPSEVHETCAKLEAALSDLVAAEAQLDESLSRLSATDNSSALDRVRVIRLQCNMAAKDVFKLRPRTNAGKTSKREVVAVYLAIVNLDQLELFAMLGANLPSQCGDDLPVAPVSSTRPRLSLWTTRLRGGLSPTKSSRV